jgi:hypothetical protein
MYPAHPIALKSRSNHLRKLVPNNEYTAATRTYRSRQAQSAADWNIKVKLRLQGVDAPTMWRYCAS